MFVILLMYLGWSNLPKYKLVYFQLFFLKNLKILTFHCHSKKKQRKCFMHYKRMINMWGRRQILHWLLAKVVWPGYNLPFQGLIEWSPFFKKRPWPIQRENAECLSKYAFAEWPDFSQMFWISSSGQSGGYYTVIGKTFHLPLLTFLYLLHFQLPRPIFYKIWSKRKKNVSGWWNKRGLFYLWRKF